MASNKSPYCMQMACSCKVDVVRIRDENGRGQHIGMAWQQCVPV